MSKPWENPAMEDLRERWKPSDTAIAYARGALAHTEFEFAIVALAHPGKDFGFWTVGTAVETVEHEAWLCDNDESYYSAIAVAGEAAVKLLDGRPGTTSYAVVHRDGTWAVFEDIMSTRA